jgi:hypothetical protein
MGHYIRFVILLLVAGVLIVVLATAPGRVPDPMPIPTDSPCVVRPTNECQVAVMGEDGNRTETTVYFQWSGNVAVASPTPTP